MKSVSPAVRWLVVIIASIGFAFDIYELLMLPLILRPAIQELAGAAATPEFISRWRSLMFYVPAVAGGIFGLFGGYLTDRLGRRRVLTWSILLYSGSAFLAGYATSLPMLLVLRCLTFIGVCVEFVAAIAWLAELFPEPKDRERVLGFTQAFSSFGGLLVAVANSIAIGYAADLPAIQVPEFAASWWGAIAPANAHQPWRYTLMSGLIPALPLILIRPFLPESPIWAQKKAEGSLSRPSIRELFAPEFRRTTIVTTLMFACIYGVAFGGFQQIPEMVRGFKDLPANAAEKTAADYAKMQEIGGLVGRFVLAFLAVRIVSRQTLLRCFQIPALLIVPLVFFCFLTLGNQNLMEPMKLAIEFGAKKFNCGTLPFTPASLGLFLSALFVVGQFSFWGNYLPRVYPVRLRGTGESFAANIGGRLMGCAFAAVTNLIAAPSGVAKEELPHRYAMTAFGVTLGVLLLGFIAGFFLPEPSERSATE